MNARIAVVKRTLHMDVIPEHLPKLAAIATPCTDLREGQVFEVQGEHIACPEGFCDYAWSTIERPVARVCRGEQLVGPDAFPAARTAFAP